MGLLILGPVIFQGFEIPERIDGLGGKQMTTVHRSIGGLRTVDAMGPDDNNPRWHGIFQGGDAVGRARQLDALRISGSRLILAWGGIARTVLIDCFEFEPERTYQVPYRIECLVTEQPGARAPTPGLSLDGLVGDDLARSGANASTGILPPERPAGIGGAPIPPARPSGL